MFRALCLAVCLCAPTFAQVTSSLLTGSVTDQSGSAVPNASVTAINAATGQSFATTTNQQGEFAVPSIPAAVYRITVSAAGFKVSAVNDVKIDAAVPATVLVKLEVGAVTESVEVAAGAEVLQTASATVSSTLLGRQLTELPIPSRNLMELIVTQPGTQTPGTPRTSSINGLPRGSVNITIDGMNAQDNLLKSDDGFFANIQPKTDAIEEVTVSTAGAGAESSGEGAAQVRFVTRSGSNDLHGGAFWQNRNTFFNSNYYYNTINRQPRDRINLNQEGGNIGGPFKKNKAFFFVNFEEFDLPQTYNVAATVPNPDVLNGIFTYQDSLTKAVRKVNLFDIAAAKNPTLPAGVRPYASSIDPSVQSILSQYLKLATPNTGTLKDRIGTQNEYNRSDFNFQTPGTNVRRFLTTHADYNINAKNHFDSVWNYQYYNSNPDGVNSIYPLLPGTGTVLGSPDSGGIRRYAFSINGTLRTTLSARLTNEARFGQSGGGSSLFREQIVPALFSQWKGYAPAIGYVNNPYRSSSQSRRNTPLWQATDNLTWARSAHLLTFGGSFTQVNSFQQNIGTQVVPTATFGIAANDPVNTGNTSLFDTTNFPNSTATNRTDAATMYAMLTGRISSISRSLALDENSQQYAHVGTIDRNRQREMAYYVQDSWKVRPNFTVNAGVRWDVQFPFTNLNGAYSSVGGLQGLYGISGVGHLFAPGVLTGTVPTFQAVKPGQQFYNVNYHQFNPSVGFAWMIPHTDAPVVSHILGRHGQSVLRAGYSISTVREDMNVPISIWGSNQGKSASLTIDPSNFPNEFGAPGSVWFRDATLPARAEPLKPNYPIPVLAGQSVNDFDPSLRQAYVQSWNLSFQRELSRSTVLDVRYVGNHSVGLWRQFDLNEVNIFESGFLNEFQIAQKNLAISQQQNPNSVNFGNAGLPGQANIPMISTALGTTSDTTFATNLQRGQAGTFANSIAGNSTRMSNLVKAGYPANLFFVNPTVGSGGSYIVENGGASSYNALQVEVRRRMAKGLLVQGSYAWSKSLTNMDASSSSVFSQPTTLRNNRNDRGPSPWDLRHGFKLNFLYELPIGPGRAFLANGNRVLGKVLEGWEITGVSRIQSGSPDLLTGRGTVNQFDNGVVLHNITAQQLNDMVNIRKTTASNGFGVVYYLPQDIINNSMAAWEVGGFTLANLDPNKPYIGPQTTAGQLGYRVFLYGPWQQRWDLSLAKKTKLGEKASMEIRAQFLNAFNATNFLLGAAGNSVNSGGITSSFGQTTSAYRDFTVSGTNDPGGRVIEFQARVRF